MSGDVQPRKRKDKRRKKDELGLEELRGTAAVFGEGDVLMHSYHEHGTGGHWCAKIIFFSLLAVLVTLIGLIILENRGLSELEANAVESRYSGVLDGWIEDTSQDDHHDEHTLELKHHNYEEIHEDEEPNIDMEQEDNQYNKNTQDDDDDTDNIDDNNHSDENDADEDDSGYEEEDDPGNESDEDIEEPDDDEDYQIIQNKEYHSRDSYQLDDDDDNDLKEDEEDNSEENKSFEQDLNGNNKVDLDENISDNSNDQITQQKKYYSHESYQQHDDEDEDNDLQEDEEDDNNENKSFEQGLSRNNDVDLDENISENSNENEDADEDDEKTDDVDEEIEKIEREVLDENDVGSDEGNKMKTDTDVVEDENDDENSLEAQDIMDAPVEEHITEPSGKPFIELEDEVSSEKPTDTLAEEEEYERRQEQLRLEKQEAPSQMWLKLVVGGALLVATHAVIRRATAPRDTPEIEENGDREETPSISDRRMTLLPEESTPLISQEIYVHSYEQPDMCIPDTKPAHSVSIHNKESEGDEEHTVNIETDLLTKIARNETTNTVQDKELYSDDEEEIEDEEEIVVEKDYPKSGSPKLLTDKIEADESETEEVPDDVEIIDDEQIEEEVEEEDEDEEEISDVDDAELLSRLEAKYGRLPEPERPGQKKDGGNSVEDEWPGEPTDPYWRQQLDIAEEEIRQGEWGAGGARAGARALGGSGRARWLAARALDAAAESRRDNRLLARAVAAYLHLLRMGAQLSDGKLRLAAGRALDRIQFGGNYLSAEPVYRLLIQRFPNEVAYRNNLTVSFLMANRADLAAEVLKETLKLWPEDRVALAHYGFVLKTQYNKLEEAVKLFRKALENDTGPACEPRFYYQLGDALLLLGRFEEAHEVHKRGAKHGHFLSPSQRSLYNVERLKSRPWWRLEQTPYVKLARALEKSWKEILKEGEAARTLYEKEKEGLKEKGDWSQLDIFVRGQEIPGRCKRAPVTCSIVKSESAAANCRRGQIKFSSMEPGTHVRPHVGPTNCRLRMHLGLSNTKDTYIRVDQETRQWQTGKVLLFDDSFEHEVWHNGTGTRLVLIVDVWHPDLTAAERRQLPAI